MSLFERWYDLILHGLVSASQLILGLLLPHHAGKT